METTRPPSDDDVVFTDGVGGAPIDATAPAPGELARRVELEKFGLGPRPTPSRKPRHDAWSWLISKVVEPGPSNPAPTAPTSSSSVPTASPKASGGSVPPASPGSAPPASAKTTSPGETRVSSAGSTAAAEPCAGCGKPLAADLATCPFCARRRGTRVAELLQTGPAVDRVSGDYVPPQLAAELEAARTRLVNEDAAERRRRRLNRTRILAAGTPIVAFLPMIFWLVVAVALGVGGKALLAIPFELAYAWGAIAWALRSGGGPHPAGLALAPGAIVRMIAGFLASASAGPYTAAMGFCMGAGTGLVSIVLGVGLGIAIELARDDIARTA